ncbi:MAG: hypothetical protein TECD_00340 [Hyphomicrobiaceae bacterium hypho_1]
MISKRRKSSHLRKTLAFGTIAVATVMNVGCSNGVGKMRTFKSVEHCIKAGFTAYICNNQYNKALSHHLQHGPRYNSLSECEKIFGNLGCERIRQPRNGSSFMPLLTSFMVARSLRNIASDYVYHRWQRNFLGYSPIPIYRNRSGANVMARRAQLGRPAIVRPTNVYTRTVTRGGFGERYHMSGSWGG